MNEEELTTSDQILGKEVVSTKGEIIGIVQKLHIHKNNKEIIGITVDEGFMKPNLFIGIENIKLFGVDAVFLNTVPNMSFKGLKVFNNEGTIVGTVIEVILNQKNSTIKEIVIKHNLKTKNIPAKAIKSIGINVLLK